MEFILVKLTLGIRINKIHQEWDDIRLDKISRHLRNFLCFNIPDSPLYVLLSSHNNENTAYGSH